MSATVATIDGVPLRFCPRAIRLEDQSILSPFVLTVAQYSALSACQGGGISASRHSDDVSLYELNARFLIERHVTSAGGLSAWKTTEAGRCILEACRIAEQDCRERRNADDRIRFEALISRQPLRQLTNLIQLPMQRSG